MSYFASDGTMIPRGRAVGNPKAAPVSRTTSAPREASPVSRSQMFKAPERRTPPPAAGSGTSRPGLGPNAAPRASSPTGKTATPSTSKAAPLLDPRARTTMDRRTGAGKAGATPGTTAARETTPTPVVTTDGGAAHIMGGGGGEGANVADGGSTPGYAQGIPGYTVGTTVDPNTIKDPQNENTIPEFTPPLMVDGGYTQPAVDKASGSNVPWWLWLTVAGAGVFAISTVFSKKARGQS